MEEHFETEVRDRKGATSQASQRTENLRADEHLAISRARSWEPRYRLKSAVMARRGAMYGY